MQGVAQCVGWFVLSARVGASVSGSFSERCLLFIHVILTIRILQVSMSWCATELVEMGVPSKWRHHGIVVVQATGVPGTRSPNIVQFLADMHRHNVTSSH